MRANWNRKHTLFLVFAVILVAVIYMLAYRLLIMPMQDVVQTNQDKIELYDKRLAVSQEKSGDSAEKQNTGKQHTSDAAPFAKTDSVLDTLQRISDKTGVTIESVTTSDKGNTGTLKTVSYDLKVIGSGVGNMNGFLDAIKNNKQYIRVDSMAVKQSGTVTLSIKLTVFSK